MSRQKQSPTNPGQEGYAKVFSTRNCGPIFHAKRQFGKNFNSGHCVDELIFIGIAEPKRPTHL